MLSSALLLKKVTNIFGFMSLLPGQKLRSLRKKTISYKIKFRNFKKDSMRKKIKLINP